MNFSLFEKQFFKPKNPISTRNVNIHQTCEDASSHCFGLPRKRWNNFQNRSFWVVGAGSGFGRSIASALALAGGRVVLSSREPLKLEETVQVASRLGAKPEQFHIIPLDLTSADSIRSAFLSTDSLCKGDLDGLVITSALPQEPIQNKPLSKLPLMGGTITNLKSLMEVNVFGQLRLLQKAITVFSRNQYGRILLFSSEAGWSSTAGFGHYNISKAALNSLGASFAAEVRDAYPTADIQLNVIDPGEARTIMNQSEAAPHPDSVLSMALHLISHPKGGPTGRFFHRDGRHLSFGKISAWSRRL